MKTCEYCPVRSFRWSRGIALFELLFVIVVIAVAVSVLVLAAHDSRRRSRAAGSLENLRFFASGTQSYAADHANKFWTFNWRAGVQNTEYADLNSAFTDLEAAANQAVYIIRTYGQSPQLLPVSGWAPHMLYSHLPLWEHLGTALPTKQHVAPEDRFLLNFQKNVDLSDTLSRGAYASSYEYGPAFYYPDARVTVNGNTRNTIQQAGYHYLWSLPSAQTPVGARRLDEVRFPSNKAQVWDRFQRDLGARVPFHSIPDARVPVLTVDGSVGMRGAASTNPGFRPNDPTNPQPTTFIYWPSFDEPPAQDPSGQDQVVGRMRWTRWGLRGRDFNGPEVTGP